MLKSLLISNYALIQKHEILFSDGFSVITGETGAGKSIMLGALALLLGKRADTQVLMDKSKKCVVEGTFDIGKMGFENLFAKNDIDFETSSVLRREIIPSGRSRAFINDTPVKLDLLKFVGEKLVDIHSQHQTLMLGNPVFQLEALDAFIGQADFLKNYRESFFEFNALNKKLQQLIASQEKAKRDEDYYRFQYEELLNANLDPEEYATLVERSKFLENAEFVIQGLSKANDQLNEGEETITEGIESLRVNLLNISNYFVEVGDLAERLNTMAIEIKDIAREISRLNSLAEFDPDEMQTVNERLDLIYRLQQKHHATTIEELIGLREEYAIKIEGLDSGEAEIKQLQAEVAKLRKITSERALILSDLRKQNGKKFATAVKEILKQLALKEASFDLQITPLNDFSKDGLDKVLFLFNANKGGTPGEIAQVASGGELSRLMLAIKSLITKEQLLPTVVFDEIDSGVSGDIAAKVGAILKNMALHHQLIVISHLPQIVAKADHHYRVFKQSGHDSTSTKIQQLNDNDRVEEIAKLLSGETISDSAIKTAKELMN
jgi:DNA repair protein RecN (Recombination protein N)